MLIYYSIPFILGTLVVVQGTLNRQIGENLGLSSAAFLNAGVLFFFSAIFFSILRWNPEMVPDFFRPRPANSPITPWYILPGLCGFCIVLGLPWSIRSIGAGKSLVLLISAQILTGFLWDFLTTNNTPGIAKILGGVLTIVGSIFVIFG